MQALNLNSRSKRALINALGSFIKLVTGNLDQSDAEHYDQLIQSLQESQVHLSEENFKTVKYLNDTNVKINNNFQSISQALNEVNIQFNRIKQQEVINMQVRYLEEFNNKLQDIISIIDLAKRNILHSLLITPERLIDEIRQVHLDRTHKFPFETLKENFYLIESLITVKAYQNRNIYVFVLQIPLIDNQEYQYFELYPLPIPINNTYVQIEPSSRFIAAYDDTYMLMNEKCTVIRRNEYLCLNQINHYNKENCELNVITHSNVMYCKFYEVNVGSHEIIEYPDVTIVIARDSIEIKEICEKLIRVRTIQGLYQIINRDNCKYDVKGSIIQNYYKINNLPTDFALHLKLNNITVEKLPQVILHNLTEFVHDNSYKFVHFDTITSRTSMITYVILVIVVLLLLYVIFKRLMVIINRRSLQRKQDVQENVPSSGGGVMCHHI